MVVDDFFDMGEPAFQASWKIIGVGAL